MSRVELTGVGVDVKGTSLVHNVSLQVGSGRWLSIIGPNGAGKSTLLRAISGVARCHGSVTIDDRPVADMHRRERAATIAWVPQTPVIPPGMRVLDYVLLGRTAHLHPLAVEGRADLELVESILDDLDLTDFARREVSTLSGGERQRTVIGRALAQQAPVLLLDEPTTALDLGHQQDVLQLLRRLQHEQGQTIVSTMHDLTLAGQFADELVLLAAGTVAARGDAADVLTESNIRDHYGASVRVTHEPDGVIVVPRTNTTTDHAERESP